VRELASPELAAWMDRNHARLLSIIPHRIGTVRLGSAVKRVGGKVYVHRDAVSELSKDEQLQVAAAQRQAGNPRGWNLVRVGPDAVMLAKVPGLGTDPHPALAESWTVTRFGSTTAPS
jgi:hypothetical protein